jgi:hypothetical protein
MILILLLSFVLGAYCQCSDPRVRKSWATLTDSEKQLYIDAVTTSYQLGHYATFASIHVTNFDDAHSTSLFLVCSAQHLICVLIISHGIVGICGCLKIILEALTPVSNASLSHIGKQSLRPFWELTTFFHLVLKDLDL